MLAGLLAGLAAVTLLMRAAPASAQDYPSKAVRLIVPFAPGAGSDVTGRLVAESLSQRLGQSVFVENRPGAGSAIGVDLAAKARPDGYTLLWSASDGLSIAAAVKGALPYRVPGDFAYIARVTGFPYMITVDARLPIKSLGDLVAYARANPGRIRYGTAGIGSGAHMATELLARRTGIQMEHIPYQGTAPALAAVLGGIIELVFSAPSAVKPYLDAGTLRVLAVTDPVRHPLFPDVPTAAEAGVPGVDTTIWWGLVAPAAVPADAVERLRRAATDMMADPTVTSRLRELGYEPTPLVGEPFRDFVVADTARWREIATAARITVD